MLHIDTTSLSIYINDIFQERQSANLYEEVGKNSGEFYSNIFILYPVLGGEYTQYTHNI